MVATLFGQVTTPALDQQQAHLATFMTYRTAPDLPEQMFWVDAAKPPETVHRHALKVGEALGDCGTTRPEVTVSAVVVTLDSTFIRSCEQEEGGLEVRVGDVETESGGWEAFVFVVRAGTDIKILTDRNLDAVGRTGDAELFAFIDGCSGLRTILADRVSLWRHFSTGFTSE